MSAPAYVLAALLARCVEVGDCLEWQGTITAGGSPQLWAGGRYVSVRKLMLSLSGRPPEVPGAKLVCTCGNRCCVAVGHLAHLAPGEFVRQKMVPGTHQGLRAAKIAATMRARHARVTAADVRAMRASDDSAEAWAARLGISAARVREIRAGKAWRDHTASPWAGMGGR